MRDFLRALGSPFWNRRGRAAGALEHEYDRRLVQQIPDLLVASTGRCGGWKADGVSRAQPESSSR